MRFGGVVRAADNDDEIVPGERCEFAKAGDRFFHNFVERPARTADGPDVKCGFERGV